MQTEVKSRSSYLAPQTPWPSDVMTSDLSMVADTLFIMGRRYEKLNNALGRIKSPR